MSLSGRIQVVATMVVTVSLTACTSTPADDGAAAKRDGSASPSAPAGPADDATAPPVLECQDPNPSLVTMTATAIAPHPGPIRAAALVRAAKTGTGTWYVVGIDRAYAADDGTLTGGSSRSLALTNAPAGASFIPLADGVADEPLTTSWDRVSWTGSRLAVGKRSLRTAIDCLDAASAQ